MSKKFINNSQKGFTIVEMMLYMGLFLMLITILTTIFTSILEVHLEAQTSSTFEQDGRYIMSRMSYDLYRASAVSVPASLGQQTDSIQFTVNGQTYLYALNDGVLELTRNGNTQVMHSPRIRVNSFTARRIGNVSGSPTLQISLILEDLDPDGEKTREYETTIGLRN